MILSRAPAAERRSTWLGEPDDRHRTAGRPLTLREWHAIARGGDTVQTENPAPECIATNRPPFTESPPAHSLGIETGSVCIQP